MNTDDLAVLVAATAAGSLSGAARSLGISPMLATRRLAALERALGVRLMHRTTRALSLTPEGETLLPFATRTVEEETELRAALRSTLTGASGLLRLTAPVAFGRKIVAPMIPTLLAANPELRIDLMLEDAVVDIVSSGYDFAIRISQLRDSGLIAHKLAETPRIFCASPTYLAAHGTPTSMRELSTHALLARSGVPHWRVRENGQWRRLTTAKRFTCNSIDGLVEACIHGAGIAMIAYWNVREELQDGRLVVLSVPDAIPQAMTIWTVYPAPRRILPKHRIFMAALRTALDSTLHMPCTKD